MFYLFRSCRGVSHFSLFFIVFRLSCFVSLSYFCCRFFIIIILILFVMFYFCIFIYHFLLFLIGLKARIRPKIKPKSMPNSSSQPAVTKSGPNDAQAQQHQTGQPWFLPQQLACCFPCTRLSQALSRALASPMA